MCGFIKIEACNTLVGEPGDLENPNSGILLPGDEPGSFVVMRGWKNLPHKD